MAAKQHNEPHGIFNGGWRGRAIPFGGEEDADDEGSRVHDFRYHSGCKPGMSSVCSTSFRVRGGGCTHFMHGRSRMTIGPRILTMLGRSTPGYRAGRHRVHQGHFFHKHDVSDFYTSMTC